MYSDVFVFSHVFSQVKDDKTAGVRKMQSCECFSPWGSIQKRPDHSTDFGCVAFVCVDSLANNPAKWLKYQQNFKPLVEGIWAIRTRETLQVYWGILGLFILAINVVCGILWFLIFFYVVLFLYVFCFSLLVFSLLLCAICLIFIALPFLMSVAPCISLLLYCCFQQQQQQQQKQQKHQQPKGQIRTTRRTRTTPHALQLFLPCCFQLPFWPFFLRLGVNTMGPRKSKWEVSLYVER